MLKKIAVTISATAFVMLAIALAPHVPTALATARHGIDDAKLTNRWRSSPARRLKFGSLIPLAANCTTRRKLRERSNV